MSHARITPGPRRATARLHRGVLAAALATSTLATFGVQSLTPAPAAAVSANSAREVRVLDLIGHRGSPKERPENTLAAVNHAIEMGADAVELDMLFTKDDRKVIFHDETLDRATNCTGRVKDITWKELKGCDVDLKAGSGFPGEGIPSLSQALRLLASSDMSIYIHVKAVKNRKQAAGLVRAVRKSGMDDGRAVIFAGGEKLLTRIRKAGADRADMGRLFTAASGWNARYGTLVPYKAAITRELVDAAHAAGKKVVAVESKPLSIDQLAGLNLDGYMANDVRSAYAALNSTS